MIVPVCQPQKRGKYCFATEFSMRSDAYKMRGRMRWGHVAAMALASWYLLVPMFDPKSGRVISLPMSDWNEEGIFDTAKECAAAKKNLVEEYRKHGASSRVQNILSSQAACVASDDPSLEGKVPFSLDRPPPAAAPRSLLGH
jgi:hypothetical protein